MKRVTHEYLGGYDLYLWPVVNLYKDGRYKSLTIRFWKWSLTWEWEKENVSIPD